MLVVGVVLVLGFKIDLEYELNWLDAVQDSTCIPVLSLVNDDIVHAYLDGKLLVGSNDMSKDLLACPQFNWFEDCWDW